MKSSDTEESNLKDERKLRYPNNYQVFVNFIVLLKKAVQTVTAIGFSNRRRTKSGIENPDQGHTDTGINTQHLYEAQGPHRGFNIPINHATCVNFGKFVYKAILVIFGYGHSWITAMREEKEKHLWAVKIVDELLIHSTMYDNEDSGAYPPCSRNENDDSEITPFINKGNQTVVKNPAVETNETAILTAAKNGVSEIVDRILNHFPVAIHDADLGRKNILLLAAENRHLEVYKLLLKRNVPKGLVIRKVDDHGNTALHFAAMHGNKTKFWPIPGAALQMQWEIKWYKFVEKSMPPRFFLRQNNKGNTPDEIFSEDHKYLVEAGSNWLTTTSTACSVVATLIATVAFASSTTFPGGTDDQSGKPTLENQPTFNLFMVSSLIALSFSVTALIMFLAILTSRHQEKDFGTDLPRKLLLGLTSLFISIVAMLASFCSGHFFVLEDKLKYAAFLVYAVTFVPVFLFAAAQFPLYVDLVRATFWSPFY